MANLYIARDMLSKVEHAGAYSTSDDHLLKDRQRLFFNTGFALLEFLGVPKDEYKEIEQAGLAPKNLKRLKSVLKKKLKSSGFAKKEAGHILKEAEGIMMMRIRRQPELDYPEKKNYSVEVERLASEVPSVKSQVVTDKRSAFLNRFYQSRRQVLHQQLRNTPGIIIQTSLSKGDYNGIRNFRKHRFASRRMVSQVHAHSFITATSSPGLYAQKMLHLYRALDGQMSAFNEFFGMGGRKVMFNISLVDGKDVNGLSGLARPLLWLLNQIKEDEFQMMEAVNAMRSGEQFLEAERAQNFVHYNENTTQKTFPGRKFYPNTHLLRRVNKASEHIQTKLQALTAINEREKSQVVIEYNQMQCQQLGLDNFDKAAFEKAGVAVATRNNIRPLLRERYHELRLLEKVYANIGRFPRETAQVLKPALEAMLASRSGCGVSLGCKSGKDRTFVVMAYLGALEQMTGRFCSGGQFKSWESFKSAILGLDFAKTVGRHMLDLSGSLIALESCDGAFGTKRPWACLPGEMKMALTKGAPDIYLQLRHELNESNRRAGYNDQKALLPPSLLSRALAVLIRFIKWVGAFVSQLFSKVNYSGPPVNSEMNISVKPGCLDADKKQEINFGKHQDFKPPQPPNRGNILSDKIGKS